MGVDSLAALESTVASATAASARDAQLLEGTLLRIGALRIDALRLRGEQAALKAYHAANAAKPRASIAPGGPGRRSSLM